VDLVAAQAEVGRGGFNVAVSNLEISPAAVARHLAPRLCGIVFINAASAGQGSRTGVVRLCLELRMITQSPAKTL